MVDEIYTVIPGKQVIAQRLRENANQYFKKKKICCKIKKVSCYMKCVQGLSESAESLFSRINKTFARLSRSIFKKKTTNDFILICYVGNWKFNLLTT